MTWLLRDGEVLAAADVVGDWKGRSKGLLGRDGYDGAMVLTRTRSVHTVGMRFAIDVAFCDRDLLVLDVARVPPLTAGPAPTEVPHGHRSRGRCLRAVGPAAGRPAGAARMSADSGGPGGR